MGVKKRLHLYIKKLQEKITKIKERKRKRVQSHRGVDIPQDSILWGNSPGALGHPTGHSYLLAHFFLLVGNKGREVSVRVRFSRSLPEVLEPLQEASNLDNLKGVRGEIFSHHHLNGHFPLLGSDLSQLHGLGHFLTHLFPESESSTYAATPLRPKFILGLGDLPLGRPQARCQILDVGLVFCDPTAMPALEPSAHLTLSSAQISALVLSQVELSSLFTLAKRFWKSPRTCSLTLYL